MRYRDFLFREGDFYPPVDHEPRIERYRENSEIFRGNHWEVFEKHSTRLNRTIQDNLYISCGLPNLIARKAADFLFGDMVQVNSGIGQNTPEQERLDCFVKENNLNILLYESALTNTYKGDSFIKIRWGQKYNGILPSKIDPFRVFIENVPSEYVFPEVSEYDQTKITAYHIAYPVRESIEKDEEWILHVESHYPGYIEYSKMKIRPFNFSHYNDITSFKIISEIPGSRQVTRTNVPIPLIVHIPNFSLENTWEGMDEYTPLNSLFAELNNRLTACSKILEAHSDPILALPLGSTENNPEDGTPSFSPSIHKVIEIMDKNEILPTYITWQGNLQESFTYIKELTSKILAIAELPELALGMGEQGTSGNSSMSIRFRMQSILSKTNRKRQYYEKGLSEVFMIAQLLEHSILGNKVNYEIIKPKFTFKDGLPRDLDAESTRVSLLVSQGLMSKKRAVQYLFEFTEEQAEAELSQIEEEMESENTFAEPSIFSKENSQKGKELDMSKEEEEEKEKVEA